MDDTKITCHLGLKLLLGNQPIPSHYQFLCLLINTAIEPKWTKNLTRPPSVVTFVGENELEKHFEQAYFRVVRFLNCIIFLYIFVWTIEIITSSFQNSQGQKLPRNQRRLIPDAWKKETISTTERYGIFITNNLPAINYIPPNTWSVTTIRRLAWRSTETKKKITLKRMKTLSKYIKGTDCIWTSWFNFRRLWKPLSHEFAHILWSSRKQAFLT